nr:MAG TPA: hypothetical protein [Bacteriophage sp.]
MLPKVSTISSLRPLTNCLHRAICFQLCINNNCTLQQRR